MSFSNVPVFSRIRQQAVSVTSTATKLPAVPLNSRRLVIIQNLSTNPIYVGSSTVTTTGATRGIVLPNQYDSITLDITAAIEVYGIAGSTSDVGVFEAI
jgi:hypothetical protein